MPDVVGVNVVEMYVPAPEKGSVVVMNRSAVVHEGVVLGPYRLKVTVPDGVAPPVMCAVSCTAVPRGPPGLAVVVSPGVALVIVTDSPAAPQLVGPTALLLVFPEMEAVQ